MNSITFFIAFVIAAAGVGLASRGHPVPGIGLIVLAAILLFALTAIAAAQSTTTGAIGGSVKDPAGAVIPNASVTATNTETNQEQTTVTSGDGTYRITNLQPGNY
ncbi:MAG: carboxypeptidase regulatory-like domain-containing protein, partial [Alphaproteobacteria bacterium]|nr:carboxypeptidase regulatory-like domain-containing protein [Alphaproteobacteria bacterium]